ncbi:uncharacterized protein [Nicotiana sylvestris]|uniref:uncharacterized protein n=1 Tax=Nicotiana sylvestris TaxID=4096 RepID=UPI00388C88FF
MDGCYYVKDKTGGIGGVIRNANGDWVIRFSKKIYALNHTHAELSALEHGLHLVINHQLTPVEIETDFIEVIELSQLKKLGNSVIRHSFQEGNKTAHALANEGSKQQSNSDLNLDAR